ncbi:MAG: polysaccharide deacetylase family protein [Acidobacteria bacterium]|nr:polysaccharide deacetylase family protein [Acidobacteriota bacterium]
MTCGRISAIITCRDLGRTLVEALRSLERQTRPAADIVVVDDASTDVYTRQVIAQLERAGTFVAHGPGRGASAARNLGARLTSGDYLVWLDADDTLEPGYFEAAAARLDAETDMDFVTCAMRAFGDVQYVWTPSPPMWVDAVATGGVPHASTVMRRRVWETLGGFDEDLPTFELLDFWASAFERGFRGIVLDEPLLNYRVRPGSGYRRSIRQPTYLARLGHFYAKHRDTVERHALALIEAKEAFLVSQRNYLKSLESRAAVLEAEQAQLRKEIADVAQLLQERNLPRVEWGDLRRRQPVSRHWGWDRGTPVDRHYIEGFLDAHRSDVRGRVLEVRDSVYTRRFGGAAVTASDVLDIDAGNGAATVIADLRRADGIASNTYDCIILTQTLQLIDDIGAAIAECARVLRPGGVLLATAPCTIRVDDEGGQDGDFWRLTEASARRLFAQAFPVDAFEVRAYGNVMANAAFLYGLSTAEMSTADLDHIDPDFPQIIAIRAVKPDADARRASHSGSRSAAVKGPRDVSSRAAILCYHRVAELSPDSHALCTPPTRFRQHMAHLRDRFTPMSVEDLVSAAASGDIPDGAVAVTLDDGYLDALTAASPILMEFGIPATFFVNTDRLDDPHERWWDILEDIFRPETRLPAELVLRAGGQELRLATATPAERAAALGTLNRSAWTMDARSRMTMANDVVAWSGAPRPPRETHRVLTGAEIRGLAARQGHAIGAHSVHHLALTAQPVETKRCEIAECKATLERALRRTVTLFSYPYGDFDGETITEVHDAGFRAGVTVEVGLMAPGTNRFLLPRIEVAPADSLPLARRLQDLFDLAAR